MKGIAFDLKKFRREHLNGMSQEEFARQIGISQDRVSRMEADPGQITLEILLQISEHFGISLGELIKTPEQHLEALQVENTWASSEFIKKTIIEYIGKNINLSNDSYHTLDDLSDIVKTSLQKPKIAFVGRSDVGKSTMINTLLGTAKMPVQWTPTTAIAVYVKHVNDRPSYMKEDVWIFKSDENNLIWDDKYLENEEYCTSLKIDSGSFEILKDYGTRSGKYFEDNQATSAVVFIDSSILLNCDIIDLPGYGTGDREEDDNISSSIRKNADILVYLSIANGFMRSEDISYLKNAITCLPNLQSENGVNVRPLENLFIVASQAHVVDNSNNFELENILNKGCERLESSLTDGFWKDRMKPDKLVDRFYTYTSNNEILRKRFEEDFCKIVEKLPKIVEKKAIKTIKDWVSGRDKILQDDYQKYTDLLEDRNKYVEALREYDKNEPERYSNFINAKSKIVEAITKYQFESFDELSQYYSNLMNVDNIVKLMEIRNVKKNKDDIQIFSTYISGLLQDKLTDILTNKSKLLSKDINNFLNVFDANTKIAIQDNISFKIAPFSKEQVFAAGLTGVATYGALAFWAATCGNLGGYILIAKGVSLLSALGISVGGTAAAVSAVAAIGGPVVLGVALAVIAAIGAFAIFTGGWRKSVAKKLVKAFDEERVLDKLNRTTSKYWIDTQNAFEFAANNLDAEWKKQIEKLRAEINNYDINAINKMKEAIEDLRNFLQNIPCLKE